MTIHDKLYQLLNDINCHMVRFGVNFNAYEGVPNIIENKKAEIQMERKGRFITVL